MSEKLKEELNKPIVKYGLLAAVFLIVVKSGIVPWLEWRSETREELTIQAGLVVDQDALSEAGKELSKKQSLLSENLQKVTALFTAKTPNPRVNLPTSVRALAETHNVSVQRISVAQIVTDNQAVDSFVVSLEGEASVDKIFAFVRSLESDKAFFKIDRLTIYDARGKSAKLRMELVKHVKA